MVWLVYCGSCIASTDQVVTGQIDVGGVTASSLPGRSREKIARCTASSRSLMRTSVPSRLISSAVFFRQTRVTL